MLIATIPLLFAILGGVLFWAAPGKWSTFGLAIFTAAMTALMIVLSKHTLHIG